MIKTRYSVKASIVFCLLVIIFSACNKYEISEKQAEVFLKFFGSYQEDVGADVQIDDDGGYVVVGTWTTTDYARQICLIKTDKYGNEVEWSPRFFGDTLDDYGYGLRILEDGYVLVGTSTDENDEKNIILVRTDKEGNAKTGFPKIFDLPGNEEGFDVDVSLNGGFAIVGYADNLPLGAGGKDLYFLETDAAGDSINARSVPYEGDEQYTCIVTISDGYMLLGQLKSLTGNQTYNIILCKANNVGRVISPIEFGTSMNDEGECLIMNPDGSGVLCGTSTSADGTQSAIFLASFLRTLQSILFK